MNTSPTPEPLTLEKVCSNIELRTKVYLQYLDSYYKYICSDKYGMSERQQNVLGHHHLPMMESLYSLILAYMYAFEHNYSDAIESGTDMPHLCEYKLATARGNVWYHQLGINFNSLNLLVEKDIAAIYDAHVTVCGASYKETRPRNKMPRRNAKKELNEALPVQAPSASQMVESPETLKDISPADKPASTVGMITCTRCKKEKEDVDFLGVRGGTCKTCAHCREMRKKSRKALNEKKRSSPPSE